MSVKSAQSVRSARPVKSVKSNKPVKPVQPAQSVRSASPVKSSKSVQSVRSASPVQSVKSNRPVKSNKSVRPVKSVSPFGQSTENKNKSMPGRKVINHKKALLPGWAVITCGILFVIGSVLLVLAGEALLTSRQVSVGQLQDSLQSQEALHNDFSTQVGLLSQPDRLLSAALSDPGRLSNPSRLSASSKPPALVSSSHSASGAHGAQASGGSSLHQPVRQPSRNVKPSGSRLLATTSDGHRQPASKGLVK